MSVRYIFSLLFFALICGFMLGACGSPPEALIMDAEDAIKAATNAGADEYSPKLLDRARAYLQDAKMLSEQGKYKEATRKAENAIIQAKKAEKNSLAMSGAMDRDEGYEEEPDTEEGGE